MNEWMDVNKYAFQDNNQDEISQKSWSLFPFPATT